MEAEKAAMTFSASFSGSDDLCMDAALFCSLVDAELHETLVALSRELIWGELPELLQIVRQALVEALGRGVVVAVRAAQRLVNHGVNEIKLLQIMGGHVHRLGGNRSLLGILPED